MVLIKTQIQLIGFKFLSFRPLTGIMVLIFGERYCIEVVQGDSFRPLTGIMVLIISISITHYSRIWTVSVPLRGLWFLSEFTYDSNNPDWEDVSVPLRGLWFLSSHANCSNDFLWGMFPSPYGDYGSYLPVTLSTFVARVASSFRPLTGIMVLICNTPSSHR